VQVHRIAGPGLHAARRRGVDHWGREWRGRQGRSQGNKVKLDSFHRALDVVCVRASGWTWLQQLFQLPCHGSQVIETQRVRCALERMRQLSCRDRFVIGQAAGDSRHVIVVRLNKTAQQFQVFVGIAA